MLDTENFLTKIVRFLQEAENNESTDIKNIGNNTVLILVIICLAVACFILLVILFLCWMKQNSNHKSNITSSSNVHHKSLNNITNRSTGFSHQTTSNVAPEQASLQTDSSMMSIDYDYSKAVTGRSVLSSVGGTRGDLSQHTLEDDSNVGSRMYRIDIYAPPGKLGVVLEKKNDEALVIYRIQDDSVMKNELRIGDQLIGVDDDDVREMAAVKVSKMLKRKDGNATRKLSIIRKAQTNP